MAWQALLAKELEIVQCNDAEKLRRHLAQLEHELEAEGKAGSRLTCCAHLTFLQGCCYSSLEDADQALNKFGETVLTMAQHENMVKEETEQRTKRKNEVAAKEEQPLESSEREKDVTLLSEEEDEFRRKAMKHLAGICLASDEGLRHLKDAVAHVDEELGFKILSEAASVVVDRVMVIVGNEGESEASRFALDAFFNMGSILGRSCFVALLCQLIRKLDELLLLAADDEKRSQECWTLCVVLCKALLSMDLSSSVDSSKVLEYYILVRLYVSLNGLNEIKEALIIGEKLINMFYEEKGVQAVEDPQRFRRYLYRYVHDKMMENPAGGFELICNCIEQFPDDAEAWKLLALYYHQVDKLDESLVAAKKALLKDKRDLQTLLIMRDLFLKKNNSEAAEECRIAYLFLWGLVVKGTPPSQKKEGSNADELQENNSPEQLVDDLISRVISLGANEKHAQKQKENTGSEPSAAASVGARKE